MRKRYNDYYLTDEEIADMHYESTEDFAKKVLGVFAFFAVFGSCILSAMCSFLGA